MLPQVLSPTNFSVKGPIVSLLYLKKLSHKFHPPVLPENIHILSVSKQGQHNHFPQKIKNKKKTEKKKRKKDEIIKVTSLVS